jgi:hypothetical protein
MRSLNQARRQNWVTVDGVGGSLERAAGDVHARVEVAAASGQVSSQVYIVYGIFKLDVGAATDGVAFAVVRTARLAHAARALSSVLTAGAFFRADLVATIGPALGNEVLVGMAAVPRL